ncbi:MAG: ATP-grasp domain-containing protein [Massilia sp.]
MTAYPSALILGVVPSLTWAVARCIRRAGGRAVVLAWHPFSPMSLSGDCSRYLTWAGIRKQGLRLDPAALDQVRRVCRSNAIDAVLSADYDTALLLAACGSEAGIPVCAVANPATLETFNNKWNLTRLVEHIGLPCPPSRFIVDEQALLDTGLGFPLITKPLDLWASVGFQVHQTREHLAATLSREQLSAPFPLIAQSFVPGCDAGASFLASHGRLRAYSVFHHRRRGWRDFKHEPRVRGYLETFIAATSYSGVGHIDLRYDQARDEYKILEINPRFWASLLYAAQAGLNYPDLLIRLPQWDGSSVQTANAREVGLPNYERVMTVLSRWCGAGYERLTGAVL